MSILLVMVHLFQEIRETALLLMLKLGNNGAIMLKIKLVTIKTIINLLLGRNFQEKVNK